MTSIPASTDAINLKARYVFPVIDEPIPDGVVTVSGSRIRAIGTRAAQGPVEDLGNVAIIPGLVNAHTHLEFSHLTQPLGNPGIDIVQWISRLMESRLDVAESPQSAVQQGVNQSSRLGTTALAEIAQPGWSPEPFDTTGHLDATVFQELIAPTADRVPAAVERAQQHVAAATSTGPWRAGLSPHAPYSVHPELLSAAVSLSNAGRIPLSFHLAESREEMELLQSGSGPFRQLLDQLGARDADSFKPGTRPLDYLQALHGAHRTLVVHGNYLDDEEISFLADHADRMAVVYCPRTHAFFAHDDYPLHRLLAAGATVALGTDSRASSPDLSILAEMQQVAQSHPHVSPAAILRLGTLDGAKALGIANHAGSLEPGKYADLAVISLPDQKTADPHELLFDSRAKVVSRYYRGAVDRSTNTE